MNYIPITYKNYHAFSNDNDGSSFGFAFPIQLKDGALNFSAATVKFYLALDAHDMVEYNYPTYSLAVMNLIHTNKKKAFMASYQRIIKE